MFFDQVGDLSGYYIFLFFIVGVEYMQGFFGEDMQDIGIEVFDVYNLLVIQQVFV